MKNKLNEEEKVLINLYKENSLDFDSNIYLRPYFEIQEISNPKKILKSELEHYYFNKSIYTKENVIPPPGILKGNLPLSSNLNNNTNINTTSLNETKIIEKEEEKKEEKKKEKEKSINNVNDKSKSKNADNQQANSNVNLNNNLQPVEKKIEIKHILDPNEYQLIDFGEKSYEKLCNYINKNNCLMWHGKLSPSIVENLFDNYSYIVKCIHERKTNLRERFAELMAEEEKKLDESDAKAKKHLFNVFLKGYLPYEYIKNNYKNILSLLQGNNPNEEEEQENLQEDEQFAYEMNNLIDHFINEDFEVIDNILRGENVKGIFIIFIVFIYLFPLYYFILF
jgi:hypothetical protein